MKTLKPCARHPQITGSFLCQCKSSICKMKKLSVDVGGSCCVLILGLLVITGDYLGVFCLLKGYIGVIPVICLYLGVCMGVCVNGTKMLLISVHCLHFFFTRGGGGGVCSEFRFRF